MTSYKPNSATVHNHFSKRFFTFPDQLKPQVLPQKCVDLLTGEAQRTRECLFWGSCELLGHR
jgi:hypothetical protein